ncbi:hypothetical protein POSPLADRAFT_1046959 [Postia placenta MAD-698-R-SB12]|uniref:Uncharacterized protein n=1 Tax=Postia placenta MAD-698-R-SB12 TaxID=670580 RepID=A0A1X6MZJ4_9APHY|nr:hypothetical protein POSPLADRAFT_1046959 [Postia placenta MAD-698-R-SB12]OSX61670.1 hypothetical protein POSPLADRAFT_1046959 [Postia placenta MAD-698-R-SB12]
MSRLVRIVPAVPPILAFHKFGNVKTKLVDAESEDMILQARTSLYPFIGGECHICGVLHHCSRLEELRESTHNSQSKLRPVVKQPFVCGTDKNAVTHKAAQVAQHNNSSHQHTQPGGTFASSQVQYRPGPNAIPLEAERSQRNNASARYKGQTMEPGEKQCLQQMNAPCIIRLNRNSSTSAYNLQTSLPLGETTQPTNTESIELSLAGEGDLPSPPLHLRNAIAPPDIRRSQATPPNASQSCSAISHPLPLPSLPSALIAYVPNGHAACPTYLPHVRTERQAVLLGLVPLEYSRPEPPTSRTPQGP